MTFKQDHQWRRDLHSSGGYCAHCRAKQVPQIGIKRDKNVMVKAFKGHAYPILSSAANLGKKGLLFSQINSKISNPRPMKAG